MISGLNWKMWMNEVTVCEYVYADSSDSSREEDLFPETDIRAWLTKDDLAFTSCRISKTLFLQIVPETRPHSVVFADKSGPVLEKKLIDTGLYGQHERCNNRIMKKIKVRSTEPATFEPEEPEEGPKPEPGTGTGTGTLTPQCGGDSSLTVCL